MRNSGAALGLIACLAASCGESRAPSDESSPANTDASRRDLVRSARSRPDVPTPTVETDPAAKWIDVLRDDRATGDRRREATRELAKLGESVVPRLLRLLDDVDLGDAAGDALRDIGEPAIAFLVATTKSSSSDERRLAAKGLGALKTPRSDVIEALTSTAATDPEAAVRWEAFKSLGRVRPDPDGTLPALVAALRDKDDWVRSKASEAIYRIGPAAAPAVDGLVACLIDDDGSVRTEAIFAIRSIGLPAADVAPRLVELAQSHPDCAESVVDALEKIAPSRVSSLLHDESAELRRAAVKSIGWIADDSTPTAIASLLDDPVLEVRHEAMEALGFVDVPPEAVPKLRANLKHPSVELRLAAAQTMARIPAPSADAARDLAAALRDEDAAVRAAAATSIGVLATAPSVCVPALVTALDDPDEKVEAAVAGAVGSFGKDAKNVVPDLRRRLAATSPWVALAAALSLVRIETPSGEAVAFATARLRDDDSRVRGAAIAILGAAHDRASLPAVIGRLDDRMPSVRVAAANVVATFGQEAATCAATLERMTRSFESGEAEAARNALEKIRPAR